MRCLASSHPRSRYLDRDHLNALTGLLVTSKMILPVTNAEVRVVVILLGLAAAVLYGSGDFLGGMATRRAHVLTVLALVETAGVIVALAVAAMWPGPASLAGLAWGTSAG